MLPVRDRESYRNAVSENPTSAQTTCHSLESSIYPVFFEICNGKWSMKFRKSRKGRRTILVLPFPNSTERFRRTKSVKCNNRYCRSIYCYAASMKICTELVDYPRSDQKQRKCPKKLHVLTDILTRTMLRSIVEKFHNLETRRETLQVHQRSGL